MGAPRILPAGLLLGIGLGGFVDGIVLHQILQWHHLLSSTGEHPPTTWRGWRRTRSPTGSSMPRRGFATVGGVCCGAGGPGRAAPPWRAPSACARRLGAFNLVEGIVDHHLLRLHHVRPRRRRLA